MAIPAGWRTHSRASDGETVGHLAPVAGDGDLVTPLSLIGTPLGPPQPEADAAVLLDRAGLAALAERWWCRLPTPIPASAAEYAADWTFEEWRAVRIVDVQPTRCTIRPEFLTREEQGRRVSLPVPVGALLSPEPPAEAES